jgi:hypothetical protein
MGSSENRTGSRHGYDTNATQISPQITDHEPSRTSCLDQYRVNLSWAQA